MRRGQVVWENDSSRYWFSPKAEMQPEIAGGSSWCQYCELI